MSDVAVASGSRRPAPLVSAVSAVTRHELRMLLYAPLTYLFLLGFLVALSACIFLVADFYASDEASIRLLLVFLPWVAMVLVPALAMAAWSGPAGDREAELATTLPVGAARLVIGKFLAGYLVLLLALLFTLPFAATVGFLGAPDVGVLAGGYLAAALLLGLFLAVAQLCAALAREQIGAFVLGLASLFVLQLLGWETIGRTLRDAVPGDVVGLLTLIGPDAWLQELGAGWVSVAGVVYFILLSAAALYGASRVVAGWARGALTPTRWCRGLAVGAAFVLAVVLLAAALPRFTAGLDLTAAGQFTPHDGTVDLLDRLPVGTEITLYWSAGESSVPAAIKSHARRVRQLLAVLADRSDGRLTVATIDPRPDSDAELTAQRAGLRRVPMSSGDHFYLGLTAGNGERVTNIAYLDPRREHLLEYDVATALHGLARDRPARIGIISPLLPSSIVGAPRDGLSFVEELKRAYDIAVIPHFEAALPDGLDALLVIDATILRSALLYEIDQFVMDGGGLVVMIDPFLRFNRASNTINPSPSGEVNDISDLLQRYGVRYLGEAVVGDSALASPVAAEDQTRMSFPFWMRIGEDGLADAHPATADLNEVFFVEPGALEVTVPERAVALVTTTADSAAHPRDGYGDKAPRDLAVSFVPDGRVRVLAAALRGPFPSAYEAQPAGTRDASHKPRSDGGARVFVVADVDWLFDPFSLQRAEIGGRTVVRPLNDNPMLLLNIVEYASGDPALVAIRSRGRLRRPFTRVAAMFKQAEARLRAEEGALARRRGDLESRIAEAVQASGAAAVDQLPPAVRDDLRGLYAALVDIRRRQRDVRHRIRGDIERLGRQVTVVNMLAGPLLVIGLAAVVRWRRRRGIP